MGFKVARILLFQSHSGISSARPGSSPVRVWFIMTPRLARVKLPYRAVMSSCLCKKAEGTVPPFVFFVVTIEDGIDDSIHARDVHEANHRASSSAHLDKASLDHVGGAQLAPERPGEVEEGEQLGQIAFELLDHRWISILPASSKTAKRPLGLAPTLCPIDRLRVGSHRLVVAPANLL